MEDNFEKKKLTKGIRKAPLMCPGKSLGPNFSNIRASYSQRSTQRQKKVLRSHLNSSSVFVPSTWGASVAQFLKPWYHEQPPNSARETTGCEQVDLDSQVKRHTPSSLKRRCQGKTVIPYIIITNWQRKPAIWNANVSTCQGRTAVRDPTINKSSQSPSSKVIEPTGNPHKIGGLKKKKNIWKVQGRHLYQKRLNLRHPLVISRFEPRGPTYLDLCIGLP